MDFGYFLNQDQCTIAGFYNEVCIFSLSLNVGMSFVYWTSLIYYICLRFFCNSLITYLEWLWLFLLRVDSHYGYHATLQDIPNQLQVSKPLLLSSSYLARFRLLIYFSVNHLKSPVGRYWLIAQPYRLLASKYIIYFEGAFSSYFFSCIYYLPLHIGWLYNWFHHACLFQWIETCQHQSLIQV